MEVETWFDRSEQNVDEESAEPFDRVREIKRMVFEVNAEDGVLTREIVLEIFDNIKGMKNFL